MNSPVLGDSGRPGGGASYSLGGGKRRKSSQISRSREALTCLRQQVLQKVQGGKGEVRTKPVHCHAILLPPSVFHLVGNN